MKKLVQDAGLSADFYIESAATTREEIGADVHPGTQRELRLHDVPFGKRRARQFTAAEYDKWDYIVAMDYENLHHLRYMVDDKDKKINLLLSFAGQDRGVAHPSSTPLSA